MKIKFLKAQNGDSILLSFQDDMFINRNILIDGGMPGTYTSGIKKGELYYAIEDIRNKNEAIDLLIITHIDEDHIGGIKKWIEKDQNACKIIRDVWFNSGRTIASYFQSDENDDLMQPLEIFETPKTSVPQAIYFEDYIEKHAIWDKKLIKKGCVAEKFGLKIQILSPTIQSLEKLLKKYKKPKYNYQTSGDELDWHTSVQDFIEEESNMNYTFENDKSITNGSSIAFLLTFKQKNYLFLGDAFPEIIIESLNELTNADKDNPLSVEFVKVSHHGSCKNTNKELLEIIKTTNYIISTNSDTHNHPNKRTLARIISKNPNANFHFNYENVSENIFSLKDKTDFEEIQIKDTLEWI
ncbi:ComEC/Rec2 family competence protein [Maribellus sediminis]|uniref:ComEC/Rec2 family competence protein n=1 Tax=Maribellus sediminis TaxID=2696285 RepID=UPI00142F8116|nr:MBL fold metallo-hydrolase [Maribellus sediminis]